jgi:hypothetical protein
MDNPLRIWKNRIPQKLSVATVIAVAEKCPKKSKNFHDAFFTSTFSSPAPAPPPPHYNVNNEHVYLVRWFIVVKETAIY